jgi:hypothetical protein
VKNIADPMIFNLSTGKAKLGPGRVEKIADPMIFNHSTGKSVSYDHVARLGMENQAKSRSLLHLTSKE